MRLTEKQVNEIVNSIMYDLADRKNVTEHLNREIRLEIMENMKAIILVIGNNLVKEVDTTNKKK